jgi:molybdenum cofactor cytidylyltransferase
VTAFAGVAGLVLAAGRSTRFGSDKLLHEVDGTPMGGHIARTLATLALAHRLAVCPADNPGRAALFAAHGFEVILNPAPEAGLSSSLALGARRAEGLDADALLVCLADMPFVSAAHLRALMERFSRTAPVRIIASREGGAKTPPVLFGRECLAELTTREGDAGARGLLAAALAVEAPAGMLRDIDRQTDLAGAGPASEAGPDRL